MKKITVMLLTIGGLIFYTDSPVSAKTYVFYGGPDGGTYQHYAKAISELSREAGLKVRPKSSGGSIVNIRVIDSGKADFGAAYSGDVFKAEKGMLTRDTKKYRNVTALAYFYGAVAQLVVRADSGITSVGQLAGRNVGTGNFGSGAAATCELFFNELGIWHKLRKKFLGYTDAAIEFKKRKLDAFWVFTGFPNGSVRQAAAENSIALINVSKDAEAIGLFGKYPYFSQVVIPANTYKGISEDTLSFQDSAIWIANAGVPADDVYKLLKTVFSDNGLKQMVKAHKSAEGMSVQNGVKGIVTPLHPGAEKFWKEKGVIR